MEYLKPVPATHFRCVDFTFVLSGATTYRLRLLGVDAPDCDQAFGPQATESVARLLTPGRVLVARAGLDLCGRTLGAVPLPGSSRPPETTVMDYRPAVVAPPEPASEAEDPFAAPPPPAQQEGFGGTDVDLGEAEAEAVEEV